MEFNPNQYNQMQAHELAAATSTTTTNVRGASVSAYGLQPVKFLSEVVQAAKQQFFFANFIREMTLEPGVSQVSIPLKSIQMQGSDVNENVAGTDVGAGTGTGTGPYKNTNENISFTAYNPLTSVTAKILPHGGGFALRPFDLHTSGVNLLTEAKDDLGYWMGHRIDTTIAKLFGTDNGLTFAQTGIRGAIQLYGGTATTDLTLTVGDVLTTDLITDALRYLKGTENWKRAGTGGKSGAFALDTTITKNGWMPTNDDPFVLFIGVAQEATLRKDSQFTNAAEYGSDTVVQNGEIGKYLDTRIVVTNHLESFGLSHGTAADGTGTAAGLTGGMTRCILMKGKQAAALVWGKQPELKTVDWAISDQILIIVWAYYDIKVLHSDAVVCIDVSNT